MLKRKNTILEKYGCEYLLNNSELALKRLNTLRRNNTFNTSKIESNTLSSILKRIIVMISIISLSLTIILLIVISILKV